MALLAVVLLLAAIAANLVALGAARLLVARSFGMEGLTLFLGGRPTAPERVQRRAQMAIVLASAAACYLVAATLFFLSYLFGGELLPDGNLVGVMPNGVAASAGIQNGDRIVAIAGTPITTWTQLADAVHSHPGEPVEARVVRRDEEITITVTPGPKGAPNEGRIGVYQMREWRPLGVAAALGRGLAGPAGILGEIALNLRQIFRAQPGGQLGVVQQAARAPDPRPADAFLIVGAYDAECWPGLVLMALLSMPRRKAPPSQKGPAKSA